MSSPSSDAQLEPPQPPKRDWQHYVKLWFGVSERVSRGDYALAGFGFMLLKYVVEGCVVWHYTSRLFMPFDFLNPVLGFRESLLRGAPQWVAWGWFVWTLPFLWLAVSMSVRRAADAGKSPWWGLSVLIPVFNLIFMLAMCFVPSKPGEYWSIDHPEPSDEDFGRGAVFAVGISIVIGGFMLWTSVYVFETYGASLFLGTPFLMSAAAAYLYNRPRPHGYGASAVVGLASVSFAALALLLFALEGVLCVAMAAPLMLPIGALGGVMGKAIADATRRPAGELMAAVLILPLLAGGERLFFPSDEFVVLSAVEIDAPPEVVWQHVIGFPDLPHARAWYFSWGIACPERARIVGDGPGAIRYCEFTTGAFVEPITAWEPPTRLAFDVTEQPPPMFELSPYHDVDAPHLHNYLRSTRGEFRLVRLAGGGTRLEGRTWYQFDMFPQWYWTIWSDALIHRIHARVLRHIKQLSEDADSNS